MLARNKLLLVLLITFIGVFNFNVYLYLDSIDSTLAGSSIDQNINNTIIGPDLITVDKKFLEIRNIPFNEKTMNCTTKSELFAAYLKENGAHDIGLVTIVHSSNQYSHEFVDWNGHFYDMCNNEVLSYKLSKKAYLVKLDKIGFNGLTIETPYS
jgi:hypothetical protein